jgi:nucleoside-diphosphate-sugar epimerase
MLSMSRSLVTGGSGFLGGVLKRRLLADGHVVVNIDCERDEDRHPNLISVRGDLRDASLVRAIFAKHSFDAVYHCAAQLAHGKMDEHLLWTSNVDATRILAEAARDFGVRPFVFISTNCLWASNLGHPVNELLDPPAPIELYGKSKLAAEQIVQSFSDSLDAVILRCPTIMDAGRLGLLAILYEFIDDGRTVWVVGDGNNRYQFIYAEDLANACILAARYGKSGLFHIGSDNVKTMRETYESVIRHAAPARPGARRRSRVRSLPRGITLWLMELAHKLKLSPLGPYHYKMIAESFLFDTTAIKRELGWRPTLTNEEMLLLAYYLYYSRNREEINRRTEASAHRKPASMGVIRILKWLS